MADRFPLDEARAWGQKPQPAIAAVHLLLYALADQGVVRREHARSVCSRLLGVEVRTVNRALLALREAGAIREEEGTIYLPISTPPGRPDPGTGSQDPGRDPRIPDRDPRIPRAAGSVVKEISNETSSLATLAAAGAGHVEAFLAACEEYVPSHEGRALEGKRVGRGTAGARDLAAALLVYEAGQRSEVVGAATVERCSDYVRRYARICEADPEERGYWSTQMLSVRVMPGRRKAAWEVVKSKVDAAALGAGTSGLSGSVRGGYGGKGVKL